MPQPTNRKSSSIAEARRGVEGDQLGEEVAQHRGQHDHDAAHGGGAALGVVAGRTVVADLLAVAEVGERADRHPGAEQREEECQTTAQQDRSHRLRSPSCSSPSATTSRAAPRDALTSTTSSAATFSRTQVSASSRPAVAHRLAPPARRARGRPRPAAARARPTTTRTSTPASAAWRPDVAVGRTGAVAELEHLAQHRRRCGPARWRADLDQRVDRGDHRGGVGVVGVVDDDQAVAAVGGPPSASGWPARRSTAARRRRRARARRRSRGRPPRPRWRPGARPTG